MMHSDLTINIQNTPTPIPCGLFYNLTKESLYIPKKGGTDINICILEDNKATAESVFKMALNSCHRLDIPAPSISCFTSPEKFLIWFRENTGSNIDVCFLDIYLKNDIDGLFIAKIMKAKNYHTLLVFMTSYDHYYTQMVQLEPFRFLPKPFQYEDFHKIFLDVYQRITLENTENKCMYSFKNNGITYSVNLNDVLYISSYKRKIFLYTSKNDTPNFYGKMDQVEREVRELTDKFMRISKSYLVNTDFVESNGKNSIQIRGVSYNISPKYKIQKNAKQH